MSSKPKEGVPVPCLHRIHSDVPKGPHAIHQSIGMSLEFSVIHEKLTHLNNDVSEMGLPSRSVMVTFDDGWVDSLLLIPLFKELQKLQPVLFLTTDQMRGNSRLLPLPRLYSGCDTM